MITTVVMPKLGLTMEEGKVVNWLKKEGDRVQKGDPIVEIETDKAVMEVEAPASGFLRKIQVGQGSTVPVAQPIAAIADTMEEPVAEAAPTAPSSAAAAPAAATAPTATTPAAPAEAAAPAGEERLKASPAARRLAEEIGVDLRQMTGTGPGGRITTEDVRAHQEQAAAAAPAPAAAPIPSPAAPAAPAAARPAVQLGQRIPATSMRWAIAQQMTISTTTVPQFFITVKADVSAANAFLQRVSPDVERERSVRLSITDVLIQASARALAQYPMANASWIGGKSMQDSFVEIHPDVNVGLAVAVPDGLIVPVIHNADKLSLADIGAARRAIVDKARAGRLSAREMSGGTFSISNLGPQGIDFFRAIVNPPEAAILATGRVVEEPVAKGGFIGIRPILYISLTCDHRVLDGAMGAEFLNLIVRNLENPTL